VQPDEGLLGQIGGKVRLTRQPIQVAEQSGELGLEQASEAVLESRRCWLLAIGYWPLRVLEQLL
jgi:hypothetical protein